MMRHMCSMTSPTSAYDGSAAAKPSAQVSAPEASIAIQIRRSRPRRIASSLPPMLAAGAMRLATAATVTADQAAGAAPPEICSCCAKTRKATSQEREPNSSQQCTA